MKNVAELMFKETDIYLIDQIIKGRYIPSDIILDAGCGQGRNMYWFLQNGYNISGIDINHTTIQNLKQQYPHLPEASLITSSVEQMPFPDQHFHHIICSAVLHFAKTTAQFMSMIQELIRVLKPGGSLFVRIASDIGLEDKVLLIEDGVYKIPDGTTRFLLTRSLLQNCLSKLNLTLLEPVKTTNVYDIRCMTTLVLQKNN